jgi:hypothetical protein
MMAILLSLLLALGVGFSPPAGAGGTAVTADSISGGGPPPPNP